MKRSITLALIAAMVFALGYSHGLLPQQTPLSSKTVKDRFQVLLQTRSENRLSERL